MKDGREGVLIAWLTSGDYIKEDYVSTYEVATACFGLAPDKAKDYALREYAELMQSIGWRKRNTVHPTTRHKGVYWIRPKNWNPDIDNDEEDTLE
jgi:hypothetical protein